MSENLQGHGDRHHNLWIDHYAINLIIMIITFTIVLMSIEHMIILTSTSAKAPPLARSKSRSIEAAIVLRPKIG